MAGDPVPDAVECLRQLQGVAPNVFADFVVSALPDGTADNSTGNGCLAFTNAGAIAGNWVYVDRGACTFGTKAANAEAAGAKGIVVGDIVAGRAPISMSGSADIYGVMVTLEDGAKFKSAGAPVSFECVLTQQVRLSDRRGEPVDAWLTLGEVVAVHIDEDLVASGVYETTAARPVVRGGGPSTYYEITEDRRFDLVRPA